MKIPQWLKKPLRLVALGAEPKDSAPLQLSAEVQRTLALMCGVNRQTMIPFKANVAGCFESMFADLSDCDVVSGVEAAAGSVILTDVADYVEVYALGDIVTLEAVIGSKTIYVPPVVSAIAYDSTDAIIATTAFRFHGKTKTLIVTDLTGGAVTTWLYNAYRFNHGKED